MLVLCGSSISNYYNKVKLALLEKGVDFREEYVATGGSDEAVLGASPLAKIPFLRTDDGPLCESQAILEYIEAAWPEPPLLPRDPSPPPRCASWRSTSTCTWSWWRATFTRRRSSGAA
jgi:glutathione S-transferase